MPTLATPLVRTWTPALPPTRVAAGAAVAGTVAVTGGGPTAAPAPQGPSVLQTLVQGLSALATWIGHVFQTLFAPATAPATAAASPPAASASPAPAPAAPPSAPAAPGITVQGQGIVFSAAYHPLMQSPEFPGQQEQCAEWVHRAFTQAGRTLPFAGNGADYWPNAANAPGFSRLPNGGGQLPRPGDLVGFAGKTPSRQYGHVAIVTQVSTAPGDAYVEVAQSNCESNASPWITERLPLDVATATVTTPDTGLVVQGFIRPDAAHDLLTPEQRAQLGSQALVRNQPAFEGQTTIGIG